MIVELTTNWMDCPKLEAVTTGKQPGPEHIMKEVSWAGVLRLYPEDESFFFRSRGEKLPAFFEVRLAFGGQKKGIKNCNSLPILCVAQIRVKILFISYFNDNFYIVTI